MRNEKARVIVCGRLNYAVWVIWEMIWFGFRKIENNNAIEESLIDHKS